MTLIYDIGGGLDIVSSVGAEEGREKQRERGREEGTASDNGGLLKRTYLMSCAASDRYECQSIIAMLGGRRREESAGRDRSQTGMEETSLPYGSKEANVWRHYSGFHDNSLSV